jgi:hypothetical protein
MRKNITGPRVCQARLRSRPRLTQQRLADRVTKLGGHIDRAGIGKIEVGLPSAMPAVVWSGEPDREAAA